MTKFVGSYQFHNETCQSAKFKRDSIGYVKKNEHELFWLTFGYDVNLKHPS